MLRPLALIAVVFATANAAEVTVEVAHGTTTDSQIAVNTKLGLFSIPIREVHLEMTFPDQKKGIGKIIVLFDPASHLFWWKFETSPGPRASWGMLEQHKATARAVIADDRIVMFSPLELKMVVIEHTEKASTLDDAQSKALQAMRKNYRRLEGDGQVTQTISLSQLPEDLFWAPFSAMPTPFKVVSAEQAGENWKIVLESRWQQELILDGDYRLVSTRKVGLR